MENITYKFSNNFENEKSSVVVTVPAMIEGEGARGIVSPRFVVALEEYTANVVPANCVISNIYLVTEDPMVGTVTVSLGGTDVIVGGDITAVGVIVGTVVTPALPAYNTTLADITLVFSDNQTEGQVKVAFDFIQLDTNTSKYVGR